MKIKVVRQEQDDVFLKDLKLGETLLVPGSGLCPEIWMRLSNPLRNDDFGEFVLQIKSPNFTLYSVIDRRYIKGKRCRITDLNVETYR